MDGPRWRTGAGASRDRAARSAAWDQSVSGRRGPPWPRPRQSPWPAALTSALESRPADSGAEVFSSTATWDGGQRIPDLVFNLPRDQQRAYMERFRPRRHPGDDRLILRTTSKDVAGQLAYLVLAQDMQVRILRGADMSRGRDTVLGHRREGLRRRRGGSGSAGRRLGCAAGSVGRRK